MGQADTRRLPGSHSGASPILESFKLPPQDLDAERSVLGSIMLSVDCLDDLDLRADEFYGLANSTTFGIICGMWASGNRAIDSVTLANQLITLGKFQEVGGGTYLDDLMEAVPHAAHVKHYARIVRQKAIQRGVIQACTAAIESAYTDDGDEVIAELERSLTAQREASTTGDLVHISEGVDQLEEREQNPAAIHKTGLADIDYALRGGLRANQLIIVAGRPGSGKSILGGQIAETFARRGDPALIVSLEMDRGELAERYVASIDRAAVRRLPLWLVDSAFDISKICGLIRLAKRKHSIQLAVLDYLQLAEAGTKRTPREQQVAEVSRAMKRLAAELKIPIIAACQLNRGAEKENRLPKISDLRESGSIEQDADIVLILHKGEDRTHLVIGKQRNGETGIRDLAFDGAKFRFENFVNSAGDYQGF